MTSGEHLFDVVVRSRTHRLIGYGVKSPLGSLEVYRVVGSGMDDEDELAGVVNKNRVEYSSAELSGWIDGVQLLDRDRDLLGTFENDVFRDLNGEIAGHTEGSGSDSDKAGAILLLIANRYFLPDGSPNPDIA